MSFAVLSIAALLLLGVVAAVASYFQGGNDEIAVGHDCSTCTSADDGSCKLHCLIEEKRKNEELKG
jgi:hypothetical protein